MGIIHLVRLVAFAVVLLFSIIVLGLSANVDATYNIDITFASLALAVAVITMVTMVPLIAVEFTRKGAFTSRVFVELIWVGILWVLWLASGAEAATLNVDPSLCSSSFLGSTGKTICSSILAVTAFSFLNWIILMAWFVTLLVFSIIGNHWHNSVADTDLTKRDTSAAGPAAFQQPNMSAAPGTPYDNYPQQSVQSSPHPQQAYNSSPIPGHTQMSPDTVPV